MNGDSGDVRLAWVQEEMFSDKEACVFMRKANYKRTSPRRFGRIMLAFLTKTWKSLSNRVSVAVEFSIRQPFLHRGDLSLLPTSCMVCSLIVALTSMRPT